VDSSEFLHVKSGSWPPQSRTCAKRCKLSRDLSPGYGPQTSVSVTLRPNVSGRSFQPIKLADQSAKSQATGLSSSRIHQLLNAPEAKEIPVWVSQLRQSSRGCARKEKTERPELETKIRFHLAREVEVLRRCIDWLQRLERDANVIVNLRPDTDVETEFVNFDRSRGCSGCWNESPPTWITSAWFRMARTRTKNRTTMILKHVIAMNWPNRHRN
jgi:hypothetical protein